MNEDVLILASRWKRLCGALIDVIILMGVIVLVMLTTGMLQQAFSRQQTIGQQVVYATIGWAVFLILNGYPLYTKGQTIGKVAVKTKIVDMGGSIPSFGRLLLLRYLVPALVAQIPIIGGLFCLVNPFFIFRKDRRCLHDHIAGTRVVNA